MSSGTPVLSSMKLLPVSYQLTASGFSVKVQNFGTTPAVIDKILLGLRLAGRCRRASRLGTFRSRSRRCSRATERNHRSDRNPGFLRRPSHAHARYCRLPRSEPGPPAGPAPHGLFPRPVEGLHSSETPLSSRTGVRASCNPSAGNHDVAVAEDAAAPRPTLRNDRRFADLREHVLPAASHHPRPVVGVLQSKEAVTATGARTGGTAGGQ
jgi:hypothetical protein